MASLGSHANVYNSCLRLLRLRGYALSLEGELDENGGACDLSWFAEKNGEAFQADNPIELLGLTAIYEYKQPAGELESYWWVIEGANIREELMDAAFPDTEEDQIEET
jgi:hypothetical protein